jgi:transcriptional regulator with XRE-family HTH domain
MNRLGTFLRKLRENAGFSIREVEQRVRKDYCEESKYQVSHTYLRNLENGAYLSPNPFKLKALCSVYGANYEKVLYLADYIEEKNLDVEFQELCVRLFEHLEAEDVNPVYFVQALLDLGPTSLSLINRTLSMLVVQERAIQKKQVGASESKTAGT